MMLVERHVLATAVVAIGVLVAAGCGGSGNSDADQGSADPASAPAGVSVAASDSDLGTILVDDSGRTLYLFEEDSNGQSACYDECAQAWPPLTTTGAPQAGAGVDQAKLATTTRTDGTTQVTYASHPLYYFANDAKAGDTNGQDVNDVWYVVSAAGDKVEGDETETETSSSTPYGGGGD